MIKFPMSGYTSIVLCFIVILTGLLWECQRHRSQENTRWPPREILTRIWSLPLDSLRSVPEIAAGKQQRVCLFDRDCTRVLQYVDSLQLLRCAVDLEETGEPNAMPEVLDFEITGDTLLLVDSYRNMISLYELSSDRHISDHPLPDVCRPAGSVRRIRNQYITTSIQALKQGTLFVLFDQRRVVRFLGCSSLEEMLGIGPDGGETRLDNMAKLALYMRSELIVEEDSLWFLNKLHPWIWQYDMSGRLMKRYRFCQDPAPLEIVSIPCDDCPSGRIHQIVSGQCAGDFVVTPHYLLISSPVESYQMNHQIFVLERKTETVTSFFPNTPVHRMALSAERKLLYTISGGREGGFSLNSYYFNNMETTDHE